MHTNAPTHLASGSLPPTYIYNVDIIILALNRFEDTLEAVESALSQLGASFHVLVLDQGSEPLIRSKFAAAFRGMANLSYFVTSTNLGVAGGRNLLTSFGNGRIIIGLDSDAEFTNPFVVADVVRKFDETEDLGALAFKILARDGLHLDLSSWGYPVQLIHRAESQFNTVTFVGAAHAIRRTTWTDAGGYDPDLFFTWEEFDFCLRAISLGWIVRYDGSISAIHKISPEARVSWSARRTRYFVRNRLIIARKWNASWAVLLPRISAYLYHGIRDHRFISTLQGIIEAIQLDRSRPKTIMPPEMREYLFHNDEKHRGSLLRQIIQALQTGARADA
jgi:GT2 family glycosyltransferase